MPGEARDRERCEAVSDRGCRGPRKIGKNDVLHTPKSQLTKRDLVRTGQRLSTWRRRPLGLPCRWRRRACCAAASSRSGGSGGGWCRGFCFTLRPPASRFILSSLRGCLSAFLAAADPGVGQSDDVVAGLIVEASAFTASRPACPRRVEIALTFHGYDRCTDGNSRKWRGSSNAPQMGARERPGDHRIPS